MFKSILLSLLLALLNNIGKAQIIDGNYKALELNGLSIDSTGNIYFYGIDSFPKEKWFFEVNVTLKGGQITVNKSPVWFTDTVKSYSASDGGFITYNGRFTKSGNIYIAKTKMIDFDYMGFSFFTPPDIADSNANGSITNNGNKSPNGIPEIKKKELYDRVEKNGNYIYFVKGTLRQDYIIRPDKNGIWINNTFYIRQKNK